MTRLLQFIEDDLPAILLAVMVAVLSAEVFARYALAHSIMGASEIAGISFTWMTYLASSGVMRRRRHIAVDILRDRLPSRGKAVLDCINLSVMAVTLCLLLWRAGKFALWTNFSLLPATGLSRRTLTLAVIVGLAGMLMHVAVFFAQALRGAAGAAYDPRPGSLGDMDELELGPSHHGDPVQ